eukprot:1106829_1
MSLSADKKRRNDRIKLIAGSSALLIGAFLYYKYVHSGSICCATKQKSSCCATEQKSSCCGAGNAKKPDFKSHVQSRYSATARNFESDTSTYVMSFHQEIYASSPSSERRNSILKTMETEILVMQRLNHPYIVRMHGTYETKHKLHIIMDECKGGELFDRIKSKNRYCERDAKPVIRMICEALFYMHDKHSVVHCDLKPDNILFADKSETSNIKIIDFGMSKVLPRLHALNHACGTPYYIAPEVLKRSFTHAADMWSVGVIAFVMIFGFPPFWVKPGLLHPTKEHKAIFRQIKKGFNPIIKKGYGAWFPTNCRSLLSKDGMDFMAHLMETDVAKRLTAKEALQHPWLVDGMGECELNLNGLEFANFATCHKFKYAMCGLFREQYKKMRPKHFEQLQHIFREMDLDGNGRISYDEFEEGMFKCKDLKLDRDRIRIMFKELDVTKEGEIEFNCLLDAVVHDYLVESDARLREAFGELDENGSGRLEVELLKTKIREMNAYAGDMEEIMQIIDEVDLDHDGTIDYKEFLRALHPDFNTAPKWFWRQNTKTIDEVNDLDAWTIPGIIGTTDAPDAHAVEDYVQVIEREQTGSIPDDLNGIMKEGWMRKEGGLIKTWKRRYFVLRNGGAVSYYRDETKQDARGAFSCKELDELCF